MTLVLNYFRRHSPTSCLPRVIAGAVLFGIAISDPRDDKAIRGSSDYSVVFCMSIVAYYHSENMDTLLLYLLYSVCARTTLCSQICFFCFYITTYLCAAPTTFKVFFSPAGKNVKFFFCFYTFICKPVF